MHKLFSNFIRCSGLACIPGGALWALSPVGLYLSDLLAKYGIFVSETIWRLLVVPVLLLMVGLVGLHVRQTGYSGGLERAGFYVALVGLILILVGDVGTFWLHLDKLYVMAAPAYRTFRAGLLVLAAGSMMYAIATLRTRALPVWSVSPLVVGSLGGLAAFSWDLGYVGAVLWALFGAGWAWLGLAPLKVSVSLRQPNPGCGCPAAIAPNAASESASETQHTPSKTAVQRT